MAGYGDDYGLVEWLRAHRVELGPAYASLVVLLLGVVTAMLQPVQALLVIGTSALGCGFWVVRARGWRRPYYTVVSMAACGWIAAAFYADTVRSWRWLLVAWLCAGILLAIPWWSDHVRRTQVQMEGVIRTWSIRAKRIRLEGTAITGMKGTATGWSALLSWLPGAFTVEAVKQRRGEIEGALGLKSGELRITDDGRSTSSIRLIAVTNDPHAAAIPWEIPTTVVADQHVLKRQRARDQMKLGKREDSTEKTLTLWIDKWGARQVLGAGIKGSGKSNLFNLFWGNFALCTDVVQWGIDLKGGMELGPWRGVFDWMVYTRDEAVLMLAAAQSVIEARMKYCREVLKKKAWEVTPDTPLLVITIDEAASLLGDAKSSELFLVEELARKGRALGVVILIATQYPTLDALGSNQIRQQIDQRFCFRMADGTGEHYIVPEYTVDAHKIPADRPGTCYHLDGEKLDPMPFRSYLISDETIEQLVSLLTGYTCVLDEVSATAAETVGRDGRGRLVPLTETDEEIDRVSTGYAEREISVPVQRDGTETIEIEDDEATENETETGENGDETVSKIEWIENGQVALDDITALRDASLAPAEREELARTRAAEAAEPARLDEREAHEALLRALQNAGTRGTTPRALADAATRKSSWLYEKLNALEAEGKARRVEAGRWTWCASHAHAE